MSRSTSGAATRTVTTSFTVRVPETTWLVIGGTRVQSGPCLGGGPSSIEGVLAVRPSLSIAAERSAVRGCVFNGRVLPGRGQAVALYRVAADGTRVLTARTTVRPDGTYRVARRFTGSGRFGFEVRVAASSTNLAGASPVRPTVVH